jgi:hypothetical protein
VSRAFAVVKIGERMERPVCLDVCTQPSSKCNTSSNTECVFQGGCDRGLSLGPKTRAWLRLQLPMKQTSGDCNESSLENDAICDLI